MTFCLAYCSPFAAPPDRFFRKREDSHTAKCTSRHRMVTSEEFWHEQFPNLDWYQWSWHLTGRDINQEWYCWWCWWLGIRTVDQHQQVLYVGFTLKDYPITAAQCQALSDIEWNVSNCMWFLRETDGNLVHTEAGYRQLQVCISNQYIWLWFLLIYHC